jgi:hypothetical protein
MGEEINHDKEKTFPRKHQRFALVSPMINQ